MFKYEAVRLHCKSTKLKGTHNIIAKHGTADLILVSKLKVKAVAEKNDFTYFSGAQITLPMDSNLVITSLITGGLLLLAFLKLSNAIEVNKKANVYFGIFVLLWATFWLDEMMIPENTDQGNYFVLLLRLVQFLVPVTFYLSIKFYTNPDFRYTVNDLRFLAVPLLFLLLLLSRPLIELKLFTLFYIIFFLSHSLFYTVLAYLKIQQHQKNIELFSSSTEAIDLRWIKYIIYSFIASALLIIGYNILSLGDGLNIYINLFFLVVVYLVAFYSVRQKEIYPKGLNIRETIAVDENEEVIRDLQKTRLMDNDELQSIKTALLKVMETDKPYLDSELNLLKLAEKMQLSSHQLSYVINTGMGENFFNFINTYRVQKAKELLTDTNYDHLNMIAIGYEAGFNSKTAFNTTFKKITTYTPTEYKKNRSDL